MSDQHGKLTHTAPACDVLAIVGDIVPLYSTAEHWQSRRELEWLKTKYVRWLKKQTFKYCLIVPGNHDMCFYDLDTKQEAIEVLESIDGVHVLIDRAVILDNVKFYGYPWTPTIQNRNWAFSLARRSPAVKPLVGLIPDDTDVLLTHGPPYGILDALPNERVGCAALMHRVLEVGPSLVLCGHIHEQRGKRTWWFDLMGHENRAINVSMCDENYSEKGARVQTYDLT